MAEPQVELYARTVANALGQEVGTALAGVYLHGSAAVGGFVPGRSDVDMLAVVHRSLADQEKQRIGASVVSIPCPGSELELFVVTMTTAMRPPRPPRYEVHVATADRPPLYDGAKHPGEVDLFVDLAMTRERGVVVLGAPAEEVIAPVPHARLLEAFAADADWAVENAPPEYRVLNACRTWRYVEDNILGSKVQGGRWALSRWSDPSFIEAALRRQQGISDEPLALPRIDLLAGHVRELLRSSMT